MSLHIITRPDAPYPPGTWFECLDDGCRKVEVETVKNRVRVVKDLGIALPHDAVFPYVTSVMKRGVLRHGEARDY